MKTILASILILLMAGCSVKISYTSLDGTNLVYQRVGFNQQITGFELKKDKDGAMKVKFQGQKSDGTEFAEVINNAISRIPVK